MSNPAKDVCDFLENEVSLSLVFGSNLFCDFLPDNPDLCVAVFAYGGPGPERNYDQGVTYDSPYVQVRVRSSFNDYEIGRTLAENIVKTLHGLHGEITNGTTYLGIWASSDVAYIGRDERKRPEWTANFTTKRSK